MAPTRLPDEPQAGLADAGENPEVISRLLRVSIESTPYGVLMVDPAGRIALYNHRLLELLDIPESLIAQRPSEEVLLRHLYEQGEYGRTASYAEIQRSHLRVTNLAPGQSETFTRMTRSGGTLEVTSHAVAGGGWVRTYIDLSEHVSAQRFIQNLTARAPGMLFQMHLTPERWLSFPFASEGINGLFALSPDEVREDAAPLLRRIHPDDVPLLRDAALNAAEFQQLWKVTYRVRLPDDRVIWHEAQSVAHREADGSINWYGFISDITDRVQTAQELTRLSELLKRRTDMLEATLGNVGHGVVFIDDDGHVAYYNQHFIDLFNLPPALLQYRPTMAAVLRYMLKRGDFVDAHTLQDLVQSGYIADWAGRVKPGRLVQQGRGGRVLEVKSSRVPSGGWVRSFADVTDYANAQREVRNGDLRLQAVLDAIPDRVWMKDTRGFYVACNPSMARAYNQSPAALVGLDSGALHNGSAFGEALVTQDLQTDAQALDNHGGVLRYEADLPLNQLGHSATFEITKVAVFNDEHQPMGVLGMARDLTERKQVEAQIQRMAFYDPLTRLSNRLLFQDRLLLAQASSARNGHWVGVYFIDLDNFKDLNDSMGHGQGDRLLKQVASRLLACVREEDTVSRFGGDEFVILLNNLGGDPAEARTAAEVVGQKVLQALNSPYDLGDTTYHTSGSVGVTLFRGSDDRFEDIMRRADLAMYHAKSAGRNALSFFEAQMQADVSGRTALERAMRVAIDQRQFLLYYQPIVDRERRVVSYEALVRWKHPDRGMVSPAAFIPLAEQTGLILPIGEWVLEEACRQLAAWARSPETEHLSVAVNLSARQLRLPQLVDQVLETIARTGANPRRLKLELTESLLLQDIEETIAKMRALAAHGIAFALDDFGTGYSSLAYLKRLPLSVLKIDQAFVRDLLQEQDDSAIAGMVISLARGMKIQVVAEGVELDQQFERLRAMGCHMFQGYLFGRPAPLAEA